METLPLDEHGFAVEEEGTPVAKGKHVVPKGVAVEELDGGKTKLSEECPAAVQDVLLKHDLVPVYDELVAAIVESSKTRGVFGGWNDKEFESILSLFKERFADKGIKVALCKRKSNSGAFRWLEFIDVDVADTYVPQYDVGNLSGQYIKTYYAKLKFPNGVAVEELDRYGKARQKLKEQIPIYVETLLKKKDLLDIYQSMVNELAEAGSGKLNNWDTPKLHEIAASFAPLFQKKNVDVVVSVKKEYVSHGQYGGHNEFFRWLEFIDRDEQPNYVPQRDAEGKKDCVVM